MCPRLPSEVRPADPVPRPPQPAEDPHWMQFLVVPEPPHPPTQAPSLPEWAQWSASKPYSIGIEEEVMLLEPDDWGLAYRAEDILAHLPGTLVSHATAETHQAVIELATSPHRTVGEVAQEARS